MQPRFTVIIILLSVNLHAQKYDFLQPITIAIIEDSITSFVDVPKLEIINITDKYWISTVYNPYKYAKKLKFPLQLKFKDSSYFHLLRRIK